MDNFGPNRHIQAEELGLTNDLFFFPGHAGLQAIRRCRKSCHTKHPLLVISDCHVMEDHAVKSAGLKHLPQVPLISLQ